MPQYDDDANQQCVDDGPNQSVDTSQDAGDGSGAGQEAAEPSEDGADRSAGAGGAPSSDGTGGDPATDPECHPDGPNGFQKAWNWWWGTSWGEDKGVPGRCLDPGTGGGGDVGPAYDGPSIGPGQPGESHHDNHGGHDHEPHGEIPEYDPELPRLPEGRTPEWVD